MSQGIYVSPTWTIGTLDVNSSATLTVFATVNSDVVDGALITNTAVVTSPASVPVTATVVVPVRRQADLLIIKAGSATSIAGTTMTYTLTYTNVGPSSAQQVFITDTLPGTLIYGGVVSAPPGWSVPTLSGQTLRWFTPTLGAGASGAFVFTVTVGPAATGQVVNRVVITTSTTDPNPVNNSSSVTTTLSSVANLELSKVASFLQPVAGTNVTFTIRVTNTGPSQATNVVISDVLPAGLSLSTTALSQGTFVSPTWSVGTLNVNSSATLTVVATVNHAVADGEPITNTAVVTSPASVPVTATAVIRPQRVANLELSKVATPAQAVAGTAVTFTIRVTNTGPSQADGVVLSDVLSSDLSFISASPSQGAYISPTWTVGTLDVNDSAVLTVVTTVNSDVAEGDLITNTAVVTSPASVPVTATVVVPVRRQADLLIIKAGSATSIAGTTMTYTLTYTNVGPSNAQQVFITDTLPGTVIYGGVVSAPPGWSVPTLTGQTLRWFTPTLGAGASGTFVFTVTVDPAATGQVVNRVVITTSTTDPNPVNNSSSVTTTLSSVANLELSKVASTLRPVAGTAVTFTIRVTNTGPSQAVGVVLSDVLPAGLSVASASTSQGTFVSPTWSVGTLNVNSSATLTVVATVNHAVADGEPITNTAVVTSPASVPVTATAVITPQRVANLELSKVATPVQAVAGTAVTFTIRVTNTGPSQADGVVLSDVLSSDLSFISASPSQGAYISPTWTVGTLDVNDSAVLTVVTTVNSDVAEGDLITNTAVVTSPASVPVTATVVVPVRRQADLLIIKAGSATSIAGTTMTYTLTYTNVGPSNAQQVFITDTLPSTLIYGGVVSAPPGWSVPTLTGQTLRWFTPTLGAGASGTFVFTVTVDPAATGQVVNSVVITTSTTDPNPVNNTSSVTTTLSAVANLQLSKVAMPAQAVAGTAVTFTIRVTNTGPSQADGVVLSDVLSSDLSFISASPSQGAYISPTWSIGTLDVNDSAVLTVVTTVNSDVAEGDLITNTAVVTSPASVPVTATVVVPVRRQADLLIIKAGSTTSIAGTTMTYTLTYTNVGPSNAQQVFITDTLPSTVIYGGVVSAPSGWAGPTLTGQTLRWFTPTLGAGASGTFVFTVTVDPAATGQVVNRVVITTSTTDPNPVNNSSSVTTSLQSVANLVLSKVATPVQAVAGTAVTFTIRVTNTGPSQAAGVVLSDVLSSDLSFISASPSQGAYISPTWSIGTLDVNDSAVLTVVTTVNSDVAEGDLITNTAVVTSPASVPVTATVVVPVRRSADLLIIKAGSATSIAGTTMTYTLTYTNVGPSNAQQVFITDTLPGTVIYGGVVSAPPGWSVPTLTGQTLRWFTPTLGAGASGTFVFTVTVDPAATGQVVNRVVITTSTTDPNPVNNTSSVTTTLSAVANLQLSKVAMPAQAVAGTAVTFTIRVTNTGPSQAAGVVLSDVLSSDLSFISASPSQGTYISPTWSIGTLDVNDSAVLTVVTTVNSDVAEGDLITNTAVVTSPASVPVTATVVVPVRRQADLLIIKAGSATSIAGTTMTYTLTYTNVGPSNAQQVFITDTLPGTVIYDGVVSAPPGWSVPTLTGQTLRWFTPTLGAGASGTFVFTVTVDPAATGQVVNRVVITTSTTDPNPVNNSSSVTTTLSSVANLELSKVASTLRPVAGTAVTFTIRVTNTGPSQAAGVTVRDVLPSGLSLVTSAVSHGAFASPAWTVGTLSVNGSAILTVVAQVDSTWANGAPITNTAVVSSPASTPITATAVITPQRAANLELSKVASALQPAAGTQVTFTIWVTNTGPSQAANVIVSDVLPSGLSLVSSTLSQGLFVSPTWTVGTLNVGDSAALTVVAQVGSDVGHGAPITNTAVVTSPASTSITARAIITPQRVVSLALSKTSPTYRAVAGTEITYTIQVTNLGPSLAIGVIVTDALPTGLTYVRARVTQGSYNGAGNVWTVGALAVGQTEWLTLTALTAPGVPISTVLVNVATAGSPYSPPVSATWPNLSNSEADMLISKTSTPEFVTAGERISYTLVITNLGPSDALNATVRDPLPAQVISNTTTWTTTLGTFDPLTGLWTNIGTLTPNMTATLRFSVATSANAVTGTRIINTATVTSGMPFDANVPGGSATVTNTVLATVDLRISKTDNNATTTPGGIVLYTLTFTNTGSAVATGVSITEVVPAGTAFVAASSSAGWSCANGSTAGTVCVWTIGTLNDRGGSGQIVFAVRVNQPAAIGQLLISNTVRIGDDGRNGPDANPGDNVATDTTPVAAAPDLQISKTDGGISTTPGGTVVYTLVYTNTGNIDSGNVTLTETLPANAAFSSAASALTVWTQIGSSNQYTTNVGAVAGLGGTGVARFGVVVQTPMPSGVRAISNVVGIGDDGRSGPDSNLGNNTGSDSTPVIAHPDLAITKTDGRTTVVPGDVLTYVVSVSNTGNQNATGVVVTDALPAWVAFVNASDGGINTNGTVVWQIGSLAGGSSVTRLVSVRVNASVPSGVTAITNTVTVADDGVNGVDSTPANNTSQDVDVVEVAPDLVIDKNDGGLPRITPNGLVTYTLTVSNVGNQDATGVVVTDVVPANTTFGTGPAGWNCAAGAPAGTACSFAIGPLPVGAITQVTLSVRVVDPLPAGVARILNTATVGDDGANGPMPNPEHRTDTIQTPQTSQPNLALSKTDGGVTARPGDTVIYTLSYTNTGDIGSTGVMITETLPANSIFNATASAPANWQQVGGTNQYVLGVGGLAGNGGTGQALFAVRVVNPLPPGVGAITNTAVIGDDGLNGTDSDPADNVAQDTTPILADPAFELAKRDGQTQVVPGQVLTYEIVLSNTGNQNASRGVVTDTLPPEVTLLTVSTGGVVNANQVVWTVGPMDAGSSQFFTVTVRVNSPLPAGATLVVNTAVATLDFGAGPTPSQVVTDTDRIDAAPVLQISKMTDGNLVGPNQLINYTVAYTNSGNIEATSVIITETVPAFTTFAGGEGWSCAIGSVAGTVCTQTVGTLAGGTSGRATFVVRVIAAPPPNAAVINTIAIGDDGAHGESPIPVTVATPLAAPVLALVKTSTPASGQPVRVGDTITYVLTLNNVGTFTATQISVKDTVPVNTQYVVGSAQPVLVAGPDPLQWQFGALGPRQSVVMTFSVVVMSFNSTINNVATAASTEISGVSSNAVLHVSLPQAITLLRFTAVSGADGVHLAWETGSEINTFGFVLYRGTSPVRTDAVAVNPTIIPALGWDNGGAAYTFVDETAQAGVGYYYWLQEVEQNDKRNDHGPISVGGPGFAQRLFLPFVSRGM